MAHRDEGLRLAPQQLLEPEDALDVEVVRRLVEQEQLGLAGQRAGDGQPLLPSAGERGHGLLGVLEPGLAHGHRDPPFALVRVGLDLARRVVQRRAHGRLRREHRVLGHVADAQPLADRARPRGRRLEAGQDLQ